MSLPLRWVILLVIVLAFVQSHMQRLAFSALIPTLVTEMGLSYAAAGTIQTAYFWTYMAAQIPIGVMTDRWGARPVMVGFMAVLAAGALAFAGITGAVSGVLARMLVGLGAAAVWVPGMRLVTEWFPPAERGRTAGLIFGGGAIGATLGLLVVPWLAALWGWRGASVALAVPAFATCLLLAAVIPSRRAGAAATAPASGLGTVLTSRAIWPLNLAVLLGFGAHFGVLTFLPAFLVVSLGATATDAGLVTSLITGGLAVSGPLAGWLSDRHGRRRPFYLAGQAAAVLLALFLALVAPHVSPARVALVTGLAGLMLGGTILPYIMGVELFPPALAATSAAVTNAAALVGALIIPVLLGRLADATGGFTLPFLAVAATQAIALGCALAIRESPRRPG